jgi:hypothetical protein
VAPVGDALGDPVVAGTAVALAADGDWACPGTNAEPRLAI